MALELRNGTVERLKTVGRPQGKGGRDSVAMFQLDGFPAEYVVGSLDWGADPVPPLFEDGDAIIASGKTRQSGVFDIYAVYIHRIGQVTGRNSRPAVVVGSLFLLISTFVAACIFFDAVTKSGNPKSLLFIFVIFSLVGFAAISTAINALVAKRMVIGASRP